MKDGKVLLYILMMLVMMGGGFAFIIWFMSGGKKYKKPEIPNLEEPFVVYHSLRNSVFPLLAFMDYIVLLMAVLETVMNPEYRTGGICVIVITAMLLSFILLKVRCAGDNTEKVLLVVDRSGVRIPEKDFFSWKDIMEVKLAQQVRAGEYVQLVVRDKKSRKGYRRVALPTNLSRYAPAYIKTILEKYRDQYH